MQTAQDETQGFTNSKLRGIALECGCSRIQAERFVKFVKNRFPNEQSESYLREWANRFRDGRHWHKMDGASKLSMLEALTQSIDGTAKELDLKHLKKAVEHLEEE